MVETAPVPIDDALDLAMQTARGLAAAHQSGIVHRDIKSATLGAAAYMSPEQARGDKVDHRAGLWALGAVLEYSRDGCRFSASTRRRSLTRSCTNRPSRSALCAAG